MANKPNEKSKKNQKNKINSNKTGNESSQSSNIDANNEDVDATKAPNKISDAVKVAIISGILGMLGTILITILTPAGQYLFSSKCTETSKCNEMPPSSNLNGREDNEVIMIGSGTVDTYLKNLGVREKIIKDSNVQILEGPTETGSKLFKFAFEGNNLLVMSSKKLSIKDLARESNIQENSQNKEIYNPNAVFEIYLGTDILQMLILTKKPKKKENVDEKENIKTEKQIKEEAIKEIEENLKNLFADILSDENDSGEINTSKTQLTFKRFIQILENRNQNPLNNRYEICRGETGSATSDLWKKHLPADLVDFNKFCLFEIQNSFTNETFDKPKIYLGSEILNREITPRSNDNKISLPINMLDNSFNKEKKANEIKEVKRGLYLYGAINPEKNNPNVSGKSYFLSPKITKVLKEIFDSIIEENRKIDEENKENRKKLIETKCVDEQIKYFHLNQGQGWVEYLDEVDKEKHVYRVNINCDERPIE